MLKALTKVKPTNSFYVILLFLVFCLPVKSQTSRFLEFDVTEGICHPFIYNINQDKNGFIWLGTGEGLCVYNGFEFTDIASDSIPTDVVNAGFTDNFGNLWFGFKNGEIFKWDGYSFSSYTLEVKNKSSISGFAQTISGKILVATLSNGLFWINENKPVPLDEAFTKELVSSIHVQNNKLFLGTQDGLKTYKLENNGLNLESEKTIEQLSYIKIQVIEPTYWENKLLVGTEDEGVFLLDDLGDSITTTKIGERTELSYKNIQDILVDENSTVWICSNNSGLIKLTDFQENGAFRSIEQYMKGEGLKTNYTKSIFLDREANTWIGTYGNGISLLVGQSFTFDSFIDQSADNNVESIATNDSLLWLGMKGKILQLSNYDNSIHSIIDHKNGLPLDNILSLNYNNGILWIGTDKQGIYQYNISGSKVSRFFSADNSLGSSINYLDSDDDNLYAATKDGVYVIDLASGKEIHYSTLNGLPHNDIEHLYLDHENRLLIATRSNGIYEINDRGEVEEYFTVGQYKLEFNSITEDTENKLWVGTFGQGVFLTKSDSIINITAHQGLKTNYCYSIVASDSNYIWVGHRLGLSRININDFSIKVFDINYGINMDCNSNAVSYSKLGKLYFGTTDGLITYDISKEGNKKIAPKTNIQKVLISDIEYDFSEPIKLSYSAYKLKIDFVGLFYNAPEEVSYQYKLDGYDLDWSELSKTRTALYPRLEDGTYTFLVKSYNYEGKTDVTPASFSISIAPPFWKTWWFITLSVLILVLSVIAIIKTRERKQKQLQEYLEQRLDERTREVVEQKEEIEVKNRDITDSINYAQRIQSSILPSLTRLQNSFSGSFVFYQPRDIVSGDFYWFDKVSDEKFIVVCADSTGHGVPGAFMSMIGTTLIKDICISNRANSPSEILRKLDEELRATLNQNADVEQSNDGMDIIVCELDLNTHYLRYSSAMRPMIVYRNSEQIYIKGSRNSVGGHYDKNEKNFKDEGIQLDKGDLVYMFSDGYPDQFGGSMGKKFKMVRMKNLLRDIYKKPMDEQYEYVKSTFNLWKEDYDQVDDVLFMGVRI